MPRCEFIIFRHEAYSLLLSKALPVGEVACRMKFSTHQRRVTFFEKWPVCGISSTTTLTGFGKLTHRAAMYFHPINAWNFSESPLSRFWGKPLLISCQRMKLSALARSLLPLLNDAFRLVDCSIAISALTEAKSFSKAAVSRFLTPTGNFVVIGRSEERRV